MKNKENNYKKLFDEIRKFRKSNEKYLLPDLYNLEKQRNYKIIVLSNTEEY